MDRILCYCHFSQVVQIIVGELECLGHVTFPEPCPKPALCCVVKLGSSLPCFTLDKGTFVLLWHLSSPSDHATPRLGDASFLAFSEVVCSLWKVIGAQSRTLPALLLVLNTGSHSFPEGYCPSKLSAGVTYALGRHIQELIWFCMYFSNYHTPK